MLDSKKYLIEMPDLDGADVWDDGRWQRNADAIMTDYPETNVFEVDAYNPEDEQENDQYMITLPEMDGADVWDSARWKRNKDAFLADHPEAQVQRIRYVDYWGDKATENRARYDELLDMDKERDARLAELGYYDDMSERKPALDMGNPINAALKPVSSAIKQNSVSGETTYLDPKVQEFYTNDDAYTERMAERTRLDEEYANNPRVVAQREYEESVARYASDLEKQIRADMESNVDMVKASRGASVKRGYDALESTQMGYLLDKVAGDPAGAGASENEKLEMYTSALNFLEKAKIARKAANKGFGGAVVDWAAEGVLDLKAQDDVEAYNEIGDILTRLEDQYGNLNEVSAEQIEASLTNEEQALIKSFFEYNAAMAEAQQDMSNWYKGGKIFAESIPFMMEFLVTGGLYKSAGKAATKGISKGLASWVKSAAKGTAKRATRASTAKAVRAVPSALVGTLARTPVSSSTYSNMAERAVEIDEDGHLNREKNLAIGFLDSYIEQLSEVSGGALSHIVGAPLRKMGNFVGSKVLSNLNFGKLGKYFGDNTRLQEFTKATKQVLANLGFHGLPEEIGEEIFGNTLRLAYDRDALGEMFRDGNFVSMLIGFAPMTLIGATGGAVRMGVANIGANNAAKRMRESLYSNYTEEQINNLEDYIRSAETSEEITQAIQPVLTVMMGTGASEEQVSSVIDFARKAAVLKTMVSAHAEQESVQRDAKKKELEQRYGKYWQEDAEGGRRVQLAGLKDGRSVFVVSQPDSQGRITVINAETGERGFANESDIRQMTDKEGNLVTISRTMALDDFASAEIMNARHDAEALRMRRERDAQISSIQERLNADPRINLGTEGAPNMVVMSESDANGVTYVDEAGNKGMMTWEQAGDAINMPIRIKTDATIAKEEAEAIALRDAERRAKRARRSTLNEQNAVDSAEAATQLQEEIEVENKHIPMNPDGTVNETAFWEQDPEGYAEWNDEQNQDGGADTMQQIAEAKAELSTMYNDAVAAQRTSDPRSRKAAKRESERLAEKIARLEALEQRYTEAMKTPEQREEERREPLRQRAKMWSETTGVEIVLVENEQEMASYDSDASAAEAEGKKVKGWARDGKAYLYLPNIQNEQDVDETYEHEIVAHIGLKGLLGNEKFNELCDRVWEMMSKTSRNYFLRYPGVNGDTRKAADEYIAHLAEKMGAEGITEEVERSIWERIVDFVKRFLESIGFSFALEERELADLLRQSYASLPENATSVPSSGSTSFSTAQKSAAKMRLDDFANEMTAEELKATVANEVAFTRASYEELLSNPPRVEPGESMRDFAERKKAYNESLEAAKNEYDFRNEMMAELESMATEKDGQISGRVYGSEGASLAAAVNQKNNVAKMGTEGYDSISTANYYYVYENPAYSGYAYSNGEINVIFGISIAGNEDYIDYIENSGSNGNFITREDVVTSFERERSRGSESNWDNVDVASEQGSNGENDRVTGGPAAFRVADNVEGGGVVSESSEDAELTPASPFFAAAEKEDSSIRFNVATEESLENKIRKFAATKDGKETGWTKEQIESIIEETKALIDAIHASSTGNEFYDEFAHKEPTIRVDWRDGTPKPIVTWTRANIEYKYDMSADLLCINNEGLESVLSSDQMVALMEMFIPEKKAKKGEPQIKFTAEDYLELYNTLRDLGFVVPCKGCFDAAGRFKMLPSVAQKFTAEVNAVIDERNKDPEAFDEKLRAKAGEGKTIDGLPTTASTKSDAIAIGVAGDNLTEHIQWTQLMSADGQTKMLSDWGGIFRAWQRTGAGRPKDKLLPEPYYGDIVSSTSTIIGKYGEKTPSFRDTLVNMGTGLRRNSHSEFRPVLAIDEIQFMRDAFIRNLTVFKYMKELDDVRLFGQMGVKFNMSFFPEFVKGTKAAGVDLNGDYIASEESVGSREFPYKGEDGKTHYDGMKGWAEAQKYINKDVSLSSVIFSIPHLIKALTDVPTPSDKSGMWGSLIPFHSSGATSASLAMQGLGLARANGVGHGFEEALYDYDKGVTNFEAVQNDRFGEGWYIVSGKKAGTDVEPGHKLEFANGNHYYNRALGLHLFASGYILDSELPAGALGENGSLNLSAKEKAALMHKFSIDYNDKVREIGTPYAYKDAADFYIAELPKLGLIPRFDFEVPEDIFLQMCADVNVDPRHPKLGWKGKGHSWTPTDSEAYYSLFCDDGMTDPATGEWAPHMPVGYVNENGEREFRLPDNAVEIVREGLERFSRVRRSESAKVDEAIREFARRSVEKGRISQESVDSVLGEDGTRLSVARPEGPIDLLEEARKVVSRGSEGASDTMFRVTPEQDKAYMDAVEAGDMETAQRMVLEAAKLAMPNTKVVDENGYPKVVYHQTNAKVYVNRETGQSWDNLSWREKMEWDERDDWDEYWEERDFNTFSRVNARTTNEFDGFFFAPKFDEYHEYGERTISAFVNIQNPASREDYNIDSRYSDAGREERIRLQEAGFDGVIRMEGEEVDEYIAFEPSQVKSADAVTYDDNGNVIPLSERFNQQNDDIRFRVLDTSKAELKDKPIKLNGMYRFKLKDAFKGVKDNGGSYPYIKVQLEEVSDDFSGEKIVYNGILEGFAVVRIPKGLIREGEKDNVFFIDPKTIENELWDVLRATENYYEFKHGSASYQRDWLNTEDIRFSVRTDEQREKLFAGAKELYGVTDNSTIAGYMLPDGSYLNFADKDGEPEIRGIDHRNIGSIINDREYESRYDYVTDFVNEGAIRMLPEYAGFQMSVAPTAEQRQKLMDYIYKYNGEVIMEITDGNGSPRVYMEYNRRTSPSRIFRDMDGYFNDGVVPGVPPISFRVAFNSANDALNSEGVSINDETLMREYGLSDIELSKRGNYVTLSKIVVKKRGEGKGTRFMRDLVENADANGWTLALTPDTAFGASSVSRLKKFYKNFGFKENKGRSADFNTKESMIRVPSGDIRFRASNENQAIFVSNAARAVEGIKQEKATPEQWLKMIEKNAGLKAGEDKWMGLSDWLKASDKKTLTKAEVLDFINENMIVIEEQHYGELSAEAKENAFFENMRNKYGEDFTNRFVGKAFIFDEGVRGEDWQLSIFDDAEAVAIYKEMTGEDVEYDEYGYPDDQSIDRIADWATGFAKAMESVNDVRDIHPTRERYTTKGLTDLHEIALAVPTIQPYHGHMPDVHFDDAGEGRAVAWIRFGDTTTGLESDGMRRRSRQLANELEKKYGSKWNYPETYEQMSEEDKAKKDEADRLYHLSDVDAEWIANKREFAQRMEDRGYPEAAERERREANEAERLWNEYRAESSRKKVLVIDEIQSQRHQDGRERGYKDTRALWADYDQRRSELKAYVEQLSEKSGVEEYKVMSDAIGIRRQHSPASEKAYIRRMNERWGAEVTQKFISLTKAEDAAREEIFGNSKGVPDAPFDKNWHELAMKRMLRYAAENGYDVIAWTKGEQQAERYNLGEVVDNVTASAWDSFAGWQDVKIISANPRGGGELQYVVDKEGKIVGDINDQYEGRNIAEVFGKEIAVKLLAEGEVNLSNAELRLGGEGMKGFYDRMLPAFMNKYGKKWGVKVEDITLPNLEEAGRIMHSVPVTEAMKESVMEGQVMFRITDEDVQRREKLLEEYKSKYNTVAPTHVVDIRSRASLAKAYGIPVKDLGWIDYLVTRYQVHRGMDAGYRGDYDIIAIFANGKKSSDRFIEGQIFHESIHKLVKDRPSLMSLGTYFWNHPEMDIIQKVKAVVEEKYDTDMYEDEMTAYVVSAAMTQGRVSELYEMLPERHTDKLDYILKKIGYEPEKEEPRRARRNAGSNVSEQQTGKRLESNARSSATRQLTAEERRVINEYFPGFDSEIRMRVDSQGRELTEGQRDFFANSKAVDKEGNLLTLYHGTARAGFTEFTSGWFTTSKEDAISYSGDRKGRLFDAAEQYVPETLTAGDYPLGYMTFDSEEDRAAFLAEHPSAETAMSEREFDSMTLQADDEYDNLIARKPELQKIWNAYREYERERFVDTTIDEILDNPDAYTEDDFRRAILAYDSNAIFDEIDEIEDSAARKDALVDALEYMKNDAAENGGFIGDMKVATRAPRNGEGISHNDSNARTYEVYANVENPYEINANGRGSEFESGDIYKAVEEALADEQYDGVIIRNWRVGRYQQLGDVVVPKNGSQTKLTSNENPSEGSDIRFKVVTDPAKIEELEDGPKVEAYRAVQIDKNGRIYSPMASRLKSTKKGTKQATNEAAQMNQWDQAVESLDKVDENGRITILDEDGGTTKVAYNPYGHCCVNSMMNDQFKRAWERDGLYVMKVLAPESELTAGYHAEKAKDAVGIHKWKTGAVGNKLPENKRREILLTRWMKNVKVMPWEEVAQDWIKTLDGENVDVPFNVVPRKILNMLAEAGVKIVAPEKGMENAAKAYEQWLADPKGYVGNTELPDYVKALNEETDDEGPDNEPRFRTTGTPTDEIVARGLDITPAQITRLAGAIFAALPEESRKEITDGLRGNILGIQDAIMQIPARLAMKESWSDEDKQAAQAVRMMVQDVALENYGHLERPLFTNEALWMLYDEMNKETDLVSQASKAIVRRNLGFSPERTEILKGIKEHTMFRLGNSDQANAAVNFYNSKVNTVSSRLSEVYLDMHESLITLQNALAEASGMPVRAWEDVALALNRLPAKNLADKNAYKRDYLSPLWDVIVDMMKNERLSRQKIEEYMMLKHGLERNEVLAKRDAKAYYQEIYNDILEKVRTMTDTEKADIFNAARTRYQNAEAERDRLAATDTTHFTDEQKEDIRKQRAEAARKLQEAEMDLYKASRISTMTESEVQDDLSSIFKMIEDGVDEKYKEFRKNDYGGITAMFSEFRPDMLGRRSSYPSEEAYQRAALNARVPKYDTLEEMEDAARHKVEVFERLHGAYTTLLWERINAATKATLRHQYDNNMLSEEQYNAVKDMFEYYIPLRGFSENTASDMYDYYSRGNNGGFANPLIAAKGRKTRAESPLGWIGSMAESAIQADNKNDAKLRLYYLALNRPDNGLVTISETWYQDTGERTDDGKRIFRPVYPPAPNRPLSGEEMIQHMDAWEQSMRKKQAIGEAYKGSQKLDLRGSVIFQDAKEESEHIVKVKVGGMDFSLMVNGNPRAAQAINGLLNPDLPSENAAVNIYRAMLRGLSALMTSWSPLFWVTNFQRDMLSSIQRTQLRKDSKAAAKFARNRWRAWRVAKYIKTYNDGTMGDSYYEELYREFAENGGITGYTVLVNNNEYDRLFDEYAKDAESSAVVKWAKSMFGRLMDMGEAIEQVSRFAAYITAREDGASIEEAVNEAKEVSVNFNRKGSMKAISREEVQKLRLENGDTIREHYGDSVGKAVETFIMIASSAPKIMKNMFFFFNASVQAISGIAQLSNKKKGSAAAWAGIYFGIGLIQNLAYSLLTGDDDEKNYENLPEYERKNNFLIKITDDLYFKWSIPQEMRPFHSAAHVIMDHAKGRSPHTNIIWDLASSTAEWLPVNPFGSGDPIIGLMPDPIAPVLENHFNISSFGGTLYNDMPWVSREVQDDIPAHLRAPQRTNATIVDITRLLNDLTNAEHDTDVQAGWLNLNPAKIEHLLQGYGGGAYTFANLTVKTLASIFGDDEFTLKNTPFINKLFLSMDEANLYTHTNELYYHYKGIADNAERVVKEYEKANDNVMAESMKKTEDWQMHLLFKQYKDDLKTYDDSLKVYPIGEEAERLKADRNVLREKLLEDIARIEAGEVVEIDAVSEMKMDVDVLSKMSSSARKRMRTLKKLVDEAVDDSDFVSAREYQKKVDALTADPEYQKALAIESRVRDIKKLMREIEELPDGEARDAQIEYTQKLIHDVQVMANQTDL